MRHMRPILLTLLILFPAYGYGLTWELGTIGGGGLCLTFGSYLDSKEAMLAEVGSSTPGKLGSSKRELFPSWSVGGYVEAGILEWFSIRAEPRVSFIGASRLALTDGGDPFDHYGIYSYGISLPILARFRTALGPGFMCFSTGPFLALTAGGLTIVDSYASSTTTVSIASAFFFGLAGGVGYALALGPGICAFEARADWALTSAAATDRLGGEIFPLGLNIMLSYGFPIGGRGK
jgi:hypothetical protein